jgi:ribosomal protein L2
MGIKKFKPTSPGVRTMTVLTNEDLTKKKPRAGTTRGESPPGTAEGGTRENTG